MTLASALQVSGIVFDVQISRDGMPFLYHNKDWEVLASFFDFSATQWTSLRTSNPIESVFASVKLRTVASRCAGSVTADEVMAFKLMQESEKKWRSIRGHQEIDKLLSAALYKDGVLEESSANQEGVA